jgi:hypothetical protein
MVGADYVPRAHSSLPKKAELFESGKLLHDVVTWIGVHIDETRQTFMSRGMPDNVDSKRRVIQMP